MLNLALGSPLTVDGRACIVTRDGAAGHAVYGPYTLYEPGRYAAEFSISAPEGAPFDGDFVCAVADVVTNAGSTVFAKTQVRTRQLVGARGTVRLPFRLRKAAELEFRVYTTGRAPLVIADHCRTVPLAEDATEEALDADRFPDPDAPGAPPVLRDQTDLLRRLYEQGVRITVAGDGLILEVQGVRINVRQPDDMMFVDEVFFHNNYNLLTGSDVCVIDVGMNVGLASLFFANKPFVREVYSFEPFPATYDRAVANFALNPDLAAKITPHNYGLSGADKESTVYVDGGTPSGALTTLGTGTGDKIRIAVRDAIPVFQRIIADARAQNLEVVAKIDCEGAEFPIFESLAAEGMLNQISAFMVEWHRGLRKTQKDLIAPLTSAGFTVFDKSGAIGNGFFYAVRSAPASAPPARRRRLWAR